jgi:hypothetical protein
MRTGEWFVIRKRDTLRAAFPIDARAGQVVMIQSPLWKAFA